jgi:FkbM family methyltransferase
MKIFYGVQHALLDVTDICKSTLNINNTILIPPGDFNRSHYFTDPIDRVQKKIFIELEEHDHIKINTITNTITTLKPDDCIDKLKKIQSRLSIKYGSLKEELPLQKMIVRYVNGNHKVLEIGGNVGRLSMVIASITNHLVVVESDPNIANQLKENRDLNHFHFQIENAALSTKPVMQKWWDTVPSDTLEEGYEWVKTITLDKVGEFDTLVLDGEDSFYYIIIDMPQILEGVKLIMMKNNYKDLCAKNYVDSVLIKHKFTKDYVESGGCIFHPCHRNYYEAWVRN